jgi:hypothetical protein
VLHVGTMKSGTSFVQALLFAQQRLLADAGVLVPGERWADQVDAVLHAISKKGPRPHWRAMAQTIRDHPGDAVISMEFLGPTVDAAARRVLRAFADSEVEVVVTARDLNRQLVSMWQETIQNGRSWTWQDYYAGARDAAPGAGHGEVDRTTPAGTFWRQQNLVRMLDTWVERVGHDNVTLVTLPHPGAPSSTLAARFAEATGLPLDAELPVPRANESLGLASALMLRQFNLDLDAAGHPWPEGMRLRKRVIAKTALAGLASDEPRLGLPVEEWVRTQSAATVEAITARGVRVVGDLADLEPVDVPGVSPEEIPVEMIARAANAALVATVADRLSKSD